ncbi:MAG: threonylcarbamoyl-AMP synthase [Bacteroidetes bacterium GWF2_43_63]|nr:MAG: threonylcarbamoyl-AMP synthase [Bacteroidetes bacterium GWE2_42_42]OFY52464.1 MAG: threonylcarbamoyl-AMP synthase [Bacteroidetes bacterium GWF2_43_63]HBG71371.1 threonylcarbamoyl-AMP synthase [Bacteroidales bacterium]HCB60878.1 threonylcarbamoyl-AMP synthase [Bacteroidales bacterium]HCY23947.1 threonylcarbamoyl-AMP synthase [Bacteroidales bacterium]
MLLEIHPVNPQEKFIIQVVESLKQGGIVIFPTDTVYALGCSLYQPKAVERIARIKGIKTDKAKFSILADGMSNLSEYTKPIGNHIFRLMKKVLPGPYTFILPASSKVPGIFESKKKTIGLRVPDNIILQMIITRLGHPLVSTSLHSDDDDYLEYVVNAELIYEKYENLVDFVIDGGPGGIEPSTILDCTGDDVEIIREGKGPIDMI